MRLCQLTTNLGGCAQSSRHMLTFNQVVLHFFIVLFQAIVSVDEKGVEAVGATGLSITLYSAFEPDIKIDVNRPFAFFIVNKSNGIILFAGKIKNPEK